MVKFEVLGKVVSTDNGVNSDYGLFVFYFFFTADNGQ